LTRKIHVNVLFNNWRQYRDTSLGNHRIELLCGLLYCLQLEAALSVTLCPSVCPVPAIDTIRYDTIAEFNVDSKAEYLALSSTRS